MNFNIMVVVINYIHILYFLPLNAKLNAMLLPSFKSQDIIIA